MALEMKVPREITAYEAKPMFGQTWRRLAALVYMGVFGGGVFAAVTLLIWTSQGSTDEALEQATSVAMFVMLPVVLPAAWWGWSRPMGLKPEIHALYFLRHHLTKKVISYADTYEHTANESVRQSSQQSAHGTRANRKTQARLRRALSEHETHETGHTSRRRGKQRSRQNRRR